MQKQTKEKIMTPTQSTPWGISQQFDRISEGIYSVMTAGHG